MSGQLPYEIRCLKIQISKIIKNTIFFKNTQRTMHYNHFIVLCQNVTHVKIVQLI